jgi:N-methylhydantoinase B/oxoprolinase/acetone carboxylase alpha subunit
MTVVTPVFDATKKTLLFLVACRAHHADVGGISPGSMPPHSRTIHDEGVLFENFELVTGDQFHRQALINHLSQGPHPARNPEQNIADLRAQIAANEQGVQALGRMSGHFGLDRVLTYMEYIQRNAEESVRSVIDKLEDGEFVCEMDGGERVQVKISIHRDRREALIDFSGTSRQSDSNLNAPIAVTRAAVLFVFRTLIDANIPLNEGCLKPLKLVVPKGSLLNPEYPAAVVAGNVETSQCVTNALYGALKVMAASQSTMNNLTFGNERYQYYETICGGSGAGATFDGTDAVHTQMTNSRMTDPEVLEARYPVFVREFSIRKNSGGGGRFKGGNGVTRRIEFRESMQAAILSNNRLVSPFGMDGGDPGKRGANYVIRNSGDCERLAGVDELTVEAGDILVIQTPGGGGYGAA